MIGAWPQRANSWDQLHQVVCVAAVVALVVVAADTPFARVVVSLVTVPFLVWWVYSRFRRTRCWLHLADPSELRVTGPGCEQLSVLRADVVDAYVVEARHWSDVWMLPRPQRVHVCLVTSSGEHIALRRFWRHVDRSYEDPPWRIAEVLAWAGKRPSDTGRS